VKLPEFAEVTFPHFGCWYASRKGFAAYATAACCFLEATNGGKKLPVKLLAHQQDSLSRSE